MARGNANKADLETLGRKNAAQTLRRQIDDLVAGRNSPNKPSSLRDFIDRKMAEDRRQKKNAAAER